MDNIINKIKELRTISEAGMMDCKRALIATNGDIEQAIDWLRKKGLATAAKKSGRIAADGLVGICINKKQNFGTLVEVNTETDFVARNESFQSFVKVLSNLALENEGDVDDLNNATYPQKKHSIATELTNLISVIGENIYIRRVARLCVDTGVVAMYLHNAISSKVGQIGVLVALESDGPTEQLTALGKQIAMHIAAANPKSCTRAQLEPIIIAKEEEVIKEQIKASGQSENITDAIAAGMRKFYEESVLCEQVFLIDNSKRKIAQVIADKAKELNCAIILKDFIVYRLGEGIKKQMIDFASEVAAQLK